MIVSVVFDKMQLVTILIYTGKVSQLTYSFFQHIHRRKWTNETGTKTGSISEKKGRRKSPATIPLQTTRAECSAIYILPVKSDQISYVY
jgi:hypothetical protein